MTALNYHYTPTMVKLYHDTLVLNLNMGPEYISGKCVFAGNDFLIAHCGIRDLATSMYGIFKDSDANRIFGDIMGFLKSLEKTNIDLSLMDLNKHKPITMFHVFTLNGDSIQLSVITFNAQTKDIIFSFQHDFSFTTWPVITPPLIPEHFYKEYHIDAIMAPQAAALPDCIGGNCEYWEITPTKIMGPVVIGNIWQQPN